MGKRIRRNILLPERLKACCDSFLQNFFVKYVTECAYPLGNSLKYPPPNKTPKLVGGFYFLSKKTTTMMVLSVKIAEKITNISVKIGKNVPICNIEALLQFNLLPFEQ